MKKILFIIFLLILHLNCWVKNQNIPFEKIENYWTWEENQNYITEGNIWHGFVKIKDLYRAYSPVSRIIFWRKTIPKTINIEYLSIGKNTVRLFVNGRLIERLQPTNSVKKITINTDKIQKGLNILGFRKNLKTDFYIKNLYFTPSKEKEENFKIEEGEKIYIPFEEGEPEILFEGRGTILINIFDIYSSKNLYSKKIKNFFPFIQRKFKFKNNKKFMVELKGEKGKFFIKDIKFSHHKLKEKSKKIKIRFKKPYPDIYIFLIDGCQASHLGIYGYNRNTSPNIDRLGKDSLIFENAYSNASFTRASVATLFTGLYPEHHKVRVMWQGLMEKFLTLPEFLKKYGYRTSIFTASGNISPDFGFKQGVDKYSGYFKRWQEFKSNLIAKDFIKWIKSTPSPRFSYIHFIEPHLPIIPPPPFKNMYKSKPLPEPMILKLHKKNKFSPEEVQDVIDDYDSTITYIDSILGKIWNFMKKDGYYENSLIIFLSDHGEALYEHKFFGHGRIVYEEIAHIPLLVKFPSYLKISGRVKKIVQVVDIFPTISEPFGERLKSDGKSLLQRESNPEEEFSVCRSFINPGSFGIRWKNYYYIINLDGFKEELYELKNNPSLNVINENKILSIYLRTKFLRWLRKYQSIYKKPKKIELEKLPKDVLENLRSLGYIN